MGGPGESSVDDLGLHQGWRRGGDVPSPRGPTRRGVGARLAPAVDYRLVSRPGGRVDAGAGPGCLRGLGGAPLDPLPPWDPPRHGEQPTLGLRLHHGASPPSASTGPRRPATNAVPSIAAYLIAVYLIAVYSVHRLHHRHRRRKPPSHPGPTRRPVNAQDLSTVHGPLDRALPPTTWPPRMDHRAWDHRAWDHRAWDHRAIMRTRPRERSRGSVLRASGRHRRTS